MLTYHEGTAWADIARLVLPGDFSARLKRPHVAELAASIDEHGLMMLPLVDKATGRVVAGVDRVAAHVVAGRAEVEVRYVEGTGEELRRAMIAENLHRRRDDEAELRQAYIQVEQEAIEAAPNKRDTVPQNAPANSGDTVPVIRRGKGRPKTARAAAREKVAAAAGVKPETLRKQEQRRKPPAAAPVIRDLGLHLSAAFTGECSEIQQALDATDTLLRQAQARLTDLAKRGLVANAVMQRLQREVHAAAVAVRAARPESVCPWCKLTSSLQPKCAACHGAGYVTAEELSAAPAELLDETNIRVARDGRFVPLFAADRPLPAPGKTLELVVAADEPPPSDDDELVPVEDGMAF